MYTIDTNNINMDNPLAFPENQTHDVCITTYFNKQI